MRRSTKRFPSTLVLLAGCLAWCGGCGPRNGRQEPSAGGHASRQGEHSRKGEPLRPPDQSLPAEEYIRLGVPAYDRPWSGADMARAAEVLAAVAAKDAAQLPRYQSERSGDLFARLLATDQNLAGSRNNSLPLQWRVQNASQDLMASNYIAKLYLDSFFKGKTGGADLIELLGAQLRDIVIVAELVDEFVPTLNKAAPSYQARMAGAKQTKQGLAVTVAGSLQILTEKEYYATPERLRLLDHMQETLPSLIPRFTPASRQEAMVRLEKMLADPNLAEFHAGLRNIQEKVVNALGKAKAR